MPQGSGPPSRIPHIHPIDEWFYVIEGELTLKLGEQTIAGRAGNFVWIPRGTVHLFTVTSQPQPQCRVGRTHHHRELKASRSAWLA